MEISRVPTAALDVLVTTGEKVAVQASARVNRQKLANGPANDPYVHDQLL
jgi:hypothetical protein